MVWPRGDGTRCGGHDARCGSEVAHGGGAAVMVGVG